MQNVSEKPFWWEAAEPQSTDPAPLPAEIDVAIVGAGFTGLGAAIPLARSGRSVTLLERDRPGDGASSRNGGIASGNIRWPFSRLVSKLGMDKAKAIYAEGMTARDDLRQFVEREGLGCDYQPNGRFAGAMTPEAFEGMKREADLMHRHLGLESVVVPRTDQHREIGSDLYTGGVHRPDIAGLHPAKLHREMRRLADAAGALTFGNTRVEKIRRVWPGFEVTTSRGVIHAKHVIVATNGYSDTGVPWLRRRLVPVISEMIATEPLSPNLMQSLMPKRQMHGETRELGYYYRPSPDGSRILLGGRRYDNDPIAARERLRRGLLSIFPELSSAALSHHWFGFVAFPTDQLPKVTVDDGIVYAAGYCGSGVVWARWMGAKAAALVSGSDGEASAFADAPFRSIPLYDGRPWFLPLMMAYYRLKDRLSGST